MAHRLPKTLEELLSSVSAQTIKRAIMESIKLGEEKVAAARVLLEDLLEELSKPPPITSLEAIVTEPILSNSFKDYLRGVYSFESWEFWCLAREYRSQFPVVSAESSLNAGFHIFNTYIKPGAELQINVSDDSVRRLVTIFGPLLKGKTGTKLSSKSDSRRNLYLTNSDSPRPKKSKKRIARESSVEITAQTFLICEKEMLFILEHQSLPLFCGTDEYASAYELFEIKKSMAETGYKNIHDFGLLPDEWSVLLEGSEEIYFNCGEQIIAQDSLHPHMYFLKSGSARAKITIGTERKGLSFDIEESSLFGELNVFVQFSRSQYSIRAMTDVTVLRFNLPLLFQFLQLNPVVALRLYCLIGKVFFKLQKAIDVYNDDGNKNISTEGLFIHVTPDPTNDYTTITFRNQFPNIGAQLVLCRFYVVVPGFFSGRSVHIYITGEYVCYSTSATHDNAESRTIPIINIESTSPSKETTLVLQTKDKRKTSFKFADKAARDAFHTLLETVIISKDPIKMGMQEPILYQPTLERKDWLSIQETASKFGTDEDQTNFTKNSFLDVYTIGDVIVRQNQRCYRVFLILQGSCIAQREHIIGKDLRKDTLHVYGMEELAGEFELFSPDAPHYSVIANEEIVKVLELNQNFIQNILFAETPDVVVRLYDQMCRGMANRICHSLRVNIKL